jgi:hypothetical protein
VSVKWKGTCGIEGRIPLTRNPEKRRKRREKLFENLTAEPKRIRPLDKDEVI